MILIIHTMYIIKINKGKISLALKRKNIISPNKAVYRFLGSNSYNWYEEEIYYQT